MSVIELSEKQLAKFKSLVAPPNKNGCCLWLGYINPHGYGEMMVNYKHNLAHRISATLAHGQIPDGGVVRHTCDTPGCVSPLHLLIGTTAENVADRVARGRGAIRERNGACTHPERRPTGARNGMYTKPESAARGSSHGMASLTEDQAREILSLKNTGVGQLEVSIKFNVAKTTVSGIWRGRNWVHLHPGGVPPLDNKPKNKLTEDKAREILALKGTGITQKEVSVIYNINKHSVHLIWAGKLWRNINPNAPFKVLNTLRGVNCALSKLNDDDVRKIIELKNTDKSQKYIAELFKVDGKTVSAIWLNKTWKHLPRPEQATA